jgi:hypothetical protein
MHYSKFANYGNINFLPKCRSLAIMAVLMIFANASLSIMAIFKICTNASLPIMANTTKNEISLSLI